MHHEQTGSEAHLFLERAEDIAKVAEQGNLYGYRRQEERLVYLFPAKLAPAPPTTSPLDVRLIYAKGMWFAEGAALGRAPVVIHEIAELYARTPFRPSLLDLLRESTVVLIGVGTIGSSLCLSLARAGVGCLILADPDNLEIANISRFEGDLLDVARPKVKVMAERIRRLNPLIRVEPYADDIFEWEDERQEELLKRADLLVASTDKTSVQLVSNARAREFGIPFLSPQAFDEARGGEVFLALPELDGVCYDCLVGGNAQPQRSGTVDYSTAQGPEDYEGEPGLHAAVDQISNVAAQMALGILLRHEPESRLGALITKEHQYLLVGTALSDGFYRFRRSFDTFFQPLKGRRTGCFTCSQNGE